MVQVRRRDTETGLLTAKTAVYSENFDYSSSGDAGGSSSGGGSGGGGTRPPPHSGGGGGQAAAASATSSPAPVAVSVPRGGDSWGTVVDAALPRTTDAGLAEALNEQYSAMLDAEDVVDRGFKGAVVGGVEGGVAPGRDAARAQVEAAGLPGAWVEHMQDLDDVAVLSAMSRGVEGGDWGEPQRGRREKSRGGAARARSEKARRHKRL